MLHILWTVNDDGDFSMLEIYCDPLVAHADLDDLQSLNPSHHYYLESRDPRSFPRGVRPRFSLTVPSSRVLDDEQFRALHPTLDHVLKVEADYEVPPAKDVSTKHHYHVEGLDPDAVRALMRSLVPRP